MIPYPRRPRLAEIIGALCNKPEGPAAFQREIDSGGLLSISPGGEVKTTRKEGHAFRPRVIAREWFYNRAVWEFLATHEYIPSSWIDHPERRYWRSCPQSGAIVTLPNGTWVSHQGNPPPECQYCRGTGYVTQSMPGPHYWLNGIIAFASDVKNIITAEALAREVWPEASFVWREVDRREWAQFQFIQSPDDPTAHPLPSHQREKILRLQSLGYSFEPIYSDRTVVLVIPAL